MYAWWMQIHMVMACILKSSRRGIKVHDIARHLGTLELMGRGVVTTYLLCTYNLLTIRIAPVSLVGPAQMTATAPAIPPFISTLVSMGK